VGAGMIAGTQTYEKQTITANKIMASAGLTNTFVMIEFQLRKSQLMYPLKALLMVQEIYSVMSR